MTIIIYSEDPKQEPIKVGINIENLDCLSKYININDDAKLADLAFVISGTDTRYGQGVATLYAYMAAIITNSRKQGKNKGEKQKFDDKKFFSATNVFVAKTIKFHESHRHNFQVHKDWRGILTSKLLGGKHETSHM